MSNFDTFYNAYLEAMTFTDFHEDNPDLINSLGFSDELLLECRQTCEKFFTLVGDRLPDFSHAGHDFWLTRNGHGAGFWDSPEVYGEDLADELTALCGYDGIFKPIDLYVGDDNLVYGSQHVSSVNHKIT